MYIFGSNITSITSGVDMTYSRCFNMLLWTIFKNNLVLFPQYSTYKL